MARRKRRKRHFNGIPLFLGAIGVALFTSYILVVAQFNRGEADSLISPTTPSSGSPAPSISPSPPNNGSAVPGHVVLDVPFISQAPQGVWDPLHEDACEEASALMVRYFMEGKNIPSIPEIDAELTNLVHAGEERGHRTSIPLLQLERLMNAHYEMRGTVHEATSVDDLKQELAAGHPVIIPAAGKVLGNPNFRDGGPNYHMLVLVGYDAEGFITNDPGTRHGEGYRYSFDTIWSAVHDYSEPDITQGVKRYLVFEAEV